MLCKGSLWVHCSHTLRDFISPKSKFYLNVWGTEKNLSEVPQKRLRTLSPFIVYRWLSRWKCQMGSEFFVYKLFVIARICHREVCFWPIYFVIVLSWYDRTLFFKHRELRWGLGWLIHLLFRFLKIPINPFDLHLTHNNWIRCSRQCKKYASFLILAFAFKRYCLFRAYSNRMWHTNTSPLCTLQVLHYKSHTVISSV